nr:hypothetical protein CKG001_10230 [Bdellovibrio sp. CKG001]
MNRFIGYMFLILLTCISAHGVDQMKSTVVKADTVSGSATDENYWKSGDAETDIAGVSVYNDGAGATKPVDCTGGTSSLSVSRFTHSTNPLDPKPLYAKYTWMINKSAANAQGQGVAFEFDVDNGVAGVQMMDLLFEYIVGSGTFAAGSDTTNSDLMVYVYDVTAGQLIEPKGGSKLYTSSTTLKGDYRGWFQSTLGSKKYRVCLHQATTSASAYTLKVDAGKVQKSINTLNNFTKEPTVRRLTSGSGTYTTPPGVKYLIVEMVGGGSGGSGSSSTTANNGGIGGTGGTTTFGSSLLIATGGSGSGTYSGNGIGGVATVNSPAISIVQLNGASGNAGVYNSSTTNPILFGSAGAATPLGGAGSQTEPLTAGKNAVANTGSGGGGAAGNGSFPSVTGSGGSAGAYIKAQINSPSLTYAYAVGAGGTGGTAGTSGYAGGAGGSGVIIITEYYSEPARMSDLYSGQNIGAFIVGGGTGVTGVGSTKTKITGMNAPVDTVGMWDSTNQQLIIKATRNYRIDYGLRCESMTDAASFCQGQLYVNGTGNGNSIAQATTIALGKEIFPVHSVILPLKAGDILDLRGSISSGTATLGRFVSTYIRITEDSGTPLMSPLVTIAARATQSSAQSIPNATPTKITFNAETYDYTGWLNHTSGTFTATAPVICSVDASIEFSSGTVHTKTLMLYKNGSQYSRSTKVQFAGTAASESVLLSDEVQLNAGETLELYLSQNTGAAATLAASASANYFTVSCRQ